MNELQFTSLQMFEALAATSQPHSSLPTHHIAAFRAALALYRHACLVACLRRFWARLTGASYDLLDLRKVQAAATLCGSFDAGVQTIPLRQIRGSECRAADFGADFLPRQEHTRDRWVGIVMSRRMGIPLPPVKVIRIDDAYFVRDGHHRISVARSLGEEFIEAEVTVWQLIPRPATEQLRNPAPTPA